MTLEGVREGRSSLASGVAPTIAYRVRLSGMSSGSVRRIHRNKTKRRRRSGESCTSDPYSRSHSISLRRITYTKEWILTLKEDIGATFSLDFVPFQRPLELRRMSYPQICLFLCG